MIMERHDTCIANDEYIRKTVHIHTIRNTQVPTIVLTTGDITCPVPRKTPAGIS